MQPLIPIEYLVLLLAAALFLAGWCALNSSGKASRSSRSLLVVLRLSAVTAVVLLALNIGRTEHARVLEAPVWAVLIDRSRSMQTADADGGRRWDAAAALARRLVAKAPPGVDVRVYPFASDLEAAVSADTWGGLTPDGEQSRLGHATASCLARHRASGDLVAVAVLSDGRQMPGNDDSRPGLQARAQNVRLFGTVFGGPHVVPDVAVRPVRRHVVVFAEQEVNLGADIETSGLGPIAPTLTLTDAAGAVHTTQDVQVEPGEPRRVEFSIRAPAEAGNYEYAVTVPRHAAERLTMNNRASFVVSVITETIRVLLVEGRPYWDSKFVAQILRGQQNMDVTEVYRVTDDRFQVISGREGALEEAVSPPLPETTGGWAGYDLVCLGTNLETVVTPLQRETLCEAVRALGLCVVFYRGNPCSSAAETWPELQPATWAAVQAPPLRLRPTRAGEAAGLFGLLLPGSEDALWAGLPAFKGARPCLRMHELAEVVLEGVPAGRAPSSDGVPVVVQRQLGRGVVLAAELRDFWQWGFFAEDTRTREFYQMFWLQMVYWALLRSEFLPGQNWSLTADRSAVSCGERVMVRVARRQGQAGSVSPRVAAVAEGKVEGGVQLAPVPGRDDRWRGSIVWQTPGIRQLLLHEPGQDDSTVRTVVQVLPPPTEDDELAADTACLERLAARSGGKLLSPDALVAELAAMRPDVLEAPVKEWRPLWDRAWVFAVVLVLFGAEWWLRRQNGLL